MATQFTFFATSSNVGQLEIEINEDVTIVTALEAITFDQTDTIVTFVANLTPAEEAALSNVVAAHDPNTPLAVSTGLELTGFVHGAEFARIGVSTVEIGSAGKKSLVRSEDDIDDVFWTGALSADITTSGAGGLDTGSEAADTWYAVHVIGDRRGINLPAALLSTSAFAPTLPAGYDIFRRIGWVRNDSGNDFLNFISFGNGRTRTVLYNEPDSAVQVLAGGSATGTTLVDCSAFIPPTSVIGQFRFDFDNDGSDSDDAGVQAAGAGISRADRPVNIQAAGSSTETRQFGMAFTNLSQEIEYSVSSGSDNLDIHVFGYTESL